MGTSATFRFNIGFLDMECSFDGSYGMFTEFTDIPKVWSGISHLEHSEHSLYIIKVEDLLNYWKGSRPNRKALYALEKILKNAYDTQDEEQEIISYVHYWEGFPKEVCTSYPGCVTLAYGD